MQDIKLYCLSCAGGTAAPYRDWKGRGVEVCPLELSGRGTRFNEPLYWSMDEVVDDLLPRIDTRHPYALFGHSLGSILCYELLVRLQKEQLPPADHAFFSAANPPGRRRVAIMPLCRMMSSQSKSISWVAWTSRLSKTKN